MQDGSRSVFSGNLLTIPGMYGIIDPKEKTMKLPDPQTENPEKQTEDLEKQKENADMGTKKRGSYGMLVPSLCMYLVGGVLTALAFSPLSSYGLFFLFFAALTPILSIAISLYSLFSDRKTMKKAGIIIHIVLVLLPIVAVATVIILFSTGALVLTFM